MTNRGILYLVATPIGNLKDITLRALKVLRSVDIIVCEDTRQTQKLLKHYQIEKRLESFFEHNEASKIPKIIGLIQNGQNVALVTDAGTPSVSDPGYRLTEAAVERGIGVVPIPGPSAVISALMASCLPTDSFVFVGFLPPKEGKRRNFILELKNETRTVVAFESPNRLIFTLKSILEILGDRQICIAREMTKIHEEFFRGSVLQSLERYSGKPVRGELTLVIGPSV